MEQKLVNTESNAIGKDKTIDSYTAQLLIMRSEMYIIYNYPNLLSLNQKIQCLKIDDVIPDDSAIYIIKSFTEEDIHKAIKYKIWSSTNFGNMKINNEFKEKQVFLLYSSYHTNQFIGIARMKSFVNFKNSFPNILSFMT